MNKLNKLIAMLALGAAGPLTVVAGPGGVAPLVPVAGPGAVAPLTVVAGPGAVAPLTAVAGPEAGAPLRLAAATGATAPSVSAKPASNPVNPVKSPLKAIEQAIEASAGGLVLPADAVGNLVVTACDRCTPVSLLVTARSQYFLKRTQVPLADLRRAIAGRPEVGVIVFYDANTHELTRLTASVSSTVLGATPSAAGAQ